MSKSLGNIVTVRQALERNSADAIRLFILSSYYRMPLRYSLEALDGAENGIERMRQALKVEGKTGGTVLETDSFQSRFIEAMDDDFNAPQAVAIMFELVRDINRGNENGMDIGKAKELLKELAGVIGFTLEETKKLEGIDESVILDKISQRNKYRAEKEWKKADEIRQWLADKGIAIEDTPKGTYWKIAR